MARRMEDIGAEFNIESQVSGGTKVRLQINTERATGKNNNYD
jgi:signal transduction histidine kinase